MKYPHSKNRLNELAGIREASFVTSKFKDSGTYNLEKLLDDLVKKEKLTWSDAHFVLSDIWDAEPRGPKGVIDLINPLPGEEIDKATASAILKAYRKDLEAEERRLGL